MTFDSAFTEVALVLLTATGIGGLALWLRQPLMVAFVAVGVLIGPAGVELVTRHEQIELLASVGIALLLFVVGLKLDWQTIRTLGPVAVVAGLGQIGVTTALGFVLAFTIGMRGLTAAYLALAFTFSSTIIVVKLLSDQREIDALHGRLAVGILILQDVAVIVAMIGIAALGTGTPAPGASFASQALGVVTKGVAFLVAIGALSRTILPRATAYLARSPELLVLAGITWAVALAASAEALDLGKEVGAFLAGASLASTPFRESLASRLVSLRDFLLLFFFVDLGIRVDLATVGQSWGSALLFAAFVLLVKPAIIAAILGASGYRKRTSFLSGVALAQVSEFSLIFVALGVRVGHIPPEVLGLVTLVGLVTIAASTYAIGHSTDLYERFGTRLGIFQRAKPYREAAGSGEDPPNAEVIVFGLGRYGGGITRHLLLRGRSVVGVDFDPATLSRWRAEGVPVIYGDAADPELFDHVPLDHASWVVSTAPDIETSRTLLHHLRARGFRGRVAVACRTADEGERLRLEGADVLLRPYADAAEQAVDALTAASNRLGVLATATPGLREVRLMSASRWAGHRIADVPLREQFGVSILAVSRGGRSTFAPGPAFQLFPGDRLILSGDDAGLEQAVAYLAAIDDVAATDQQDDFDVETVPIRELPEWIGQTLTSLEPTTRFGVTVLAVAGVDQQLRSPETQRTLTAEDRVVLGGPAARLRALREIPLADRHR